MAVDADRYIWLISHFGVAQRAINKWNPKYDKPMLKYLQDIIDKGVAEEGPRFIEAQRKLLQ